MSTRGRHNDRWKARVTNVTNLKNDIKHWQRSYERKSQREHLVDNEVLNIVTEAIMILLVMSRQLRNWTEHSRIITVVIVNEQFYFLWYCIFANISCLFHSGIIVFSSLKWMTSTKPATYYSYIPMWVVVDGSVILASLSPVCLTLTPVHSRILLQW